MKTKTLTRKELYDLVCTKPLTALSDEFSISAHSIKMICNDHQIPLPPNGHWSKLKFGKPSKLLPLSKDYSGSDEINLDEVLKTSDSKHSLLIKKVKEIQETSKNPLQVPQKLSNPDPLIVSTKNYHEARKRHDYLSNQPYPERVNVLNIDVSEYNAARAYRVMDSVIKMLRVRNYDIKIRDFESFAVIDSIEIEFRLREKRKAVTSNDEWRVRNLEPTGKLVFIIGHYDRKEINDGLEPLENKLAEILARFESEAERIKQWRIEIERDRKIAEEKRRIENEIREQKEKESKKFKNLFLSATRLHQANIMRSYIRTVEANAIEKQQLTSELQDWIDWAIKKADWYDPLVNGEDPLLNNDYKTGIFKELLKEWQ